MTLSALLLLSHAALPLVAENASNFSANSIPRIVHRFQRPLAVPRPGPRRPWAVSSLERREVQLGRRIRRAFIQQREGFILGKIKAMLGIGPCELNCQQDKKIKQDQESPELLIYPRETGAGGL